MNKEDLGEYSVILLIKRGKCTFSQKILNAQESGASMVIIANDHKEDLGSLFPFEKQADVL